MINDAEVAPKIKESKNGGRKAKKESKHLETISDFSKKLKIGEFLFLVKSVKKSVND